MDAIIFCTYKRFCAYFVHARVFFELNMWIYRPCWAGWWVIKTNPVTRNHQSRIEHAKIVLIYHKSDLITTVWFFQKKTSANCTRDFFTWSISSFPSPSTLRRAGPKEPCDVQRLSPWNPSVDSKRQGNTAKSYKIRAAHGQEHIRKRPNHVDGSIKQKSFRILQAYLFNASGYALDWVADKLKNCGPCNKNHKHD